MIVPERLIATKIKFYLRSDDLSRSRHVLPRSGAARGGLVENFLRMIRASSAARSYAKRLAQLIEIIGTLRGRFADLFVSNSFADAYVHATIQTQMRMIVN